MTSIICVEYADPLQTIGHTSMILMWNKQQDGTELEMHYQ
jgi:hypothetical protein